MSGLGFSRTTKWTGTTTSLTVSVLRQLVEASKDAPEDTPVSVVISPGDRPFETAMVYINIPKQGLG